MLSSFFYLLVGALITGIITFIVNALNWKNDKLHNHYQSLYNLLINYQDSLTSLLSDFFKDADHFAFYVQKAQEHSDQLKQLAKESQTTLSKNCPAYDSESEKCNHCFIPSKEGNQIFNEFNDLLEKSSKQDKLVHNYWIEKADILNDRIKQFSNITTLALKKRNENSEFISLLRRLDNASVKLTSNIYTQSQDMTSNSLFQILSMIEESQSYVISQLKL